MGQFDADLLYCQAQNVRAGIHFPDNIRNSRFIGRESDARVTCIPVAICGRSARSDT